MQKLGKTELFLCLIIQQRFVTLYIAITILTQKGLGSAKFEIWQHRRSPVQKRLQWKNTSTPFP